MSAEPNRVFSEQEAAEILQRAVSLADQTAGYTPGVTLEELQRIASEAGLPADALRKALTEHESRVPAGGKPTPGAAVERVLEGELRPEDFDIALDGLRIRRHRRAGIEQVGRTLRAGIWYGTQMMEIHLTSRNGRTRISVRPQVFRSVFFPAFFSFYAALIGSVFLSLASVPELVVIWIVVAVSLGIGGSRRALVLAQPKANELADSLASKVADTLASYPQPVTNSVAGPVTLEERLQDRA